MKIEEHISLAQFTAFRIGGKARFFIEAETAEDIKESVQFSKTKKLPLFILGGGSNLLVGDGEFEGVVIKINLKGIEFEERGDSVFVTAGAGVVWDDLVASAVSRNLWGIENLSAIPGTVGASPVQNIGAYGAELKDTLVEVEVFDTKTDSIKKLSHTECGFGYRDSIFKKTEGSHLVVTSVTLQLSSKPRLNISYKDLKEFFSKRNTAPSLLDIRNAVIEIRKNKLPSLEEFGTAGSFFKNPIISKKHYEFLLQKYPELPSFEVDSERVKVPLAWILDKVCDLKGFKEGKVGLYEKQPLAIVNFGGATAEDVKNLALKIAKTVKEKTDIDVEWEVQELKN